MKIEEVIDLLWERSNHGTRREDVVAAFEAGALSERQACAQLADDHEAWRDNPANVIARKIRERSSGLAHAECIADADVHAEVVRATEERIAQTLEHWQILDAIAKRKSELGE